MDPAKPAPPGKPKRPKTKSKRQGKPPNRRTGGGRRSSKAKRAERGSGSSAAEAAARAAARATVDPGEKPFSKSITTTVRAVVHCDGHGVPNVGGACLLKRRARAVALELLCFLFHLRCCALLILRLCQQCGGWSGFAVRAGCAAQCLSYAQRVAASMSPRWIVLLSRLRSSVPYPPCSNLLPLLQYLSYPPRTAGCSPRALPRKTATSTSVSSSTAPPSSASSPRVGGTLRAART